MLSLFSSLHSIAARRGDGLRHELVALLKNQESNSKKRISTSLACELEMARQKVSTPLFTEPRGPKMSREQLNKAIVGRWFEGFWGNPWNPSIIDELAAPDVLLQYSLHAPRRGREDVRNFMMDFRAAFPDLKFWGAADLIAEGDVVVGRWEGGGTHTGPAFSDFLVGSLPAASGRKMRFTGTTVLRVENGKIAEEIGLDDGVTALQQLGILKAAA
jgi:predicted ester cyclase